MHRFRSLSILVVGLGAVGGACVEALARSGIGKLHLVDGDTFDVTNLNRQPFAQQSVLGQPKAFVTQQALADLAPHTVTTSEVCFITPKNIEALLARIRPNIVVDAIDDLKAKVALLATCVQRNLPIWSAMGAARKLDPTAFRVTDIAKTQICPLARAVRHELRTRGIHKGIRCVWSTEPAQPLSVDGTLGSYMPVTATAGLLLAADLLQQLSKRIHL